MKSLLPNIVMYDRGFVRFGGVKCAIYLTTLIHNHQHWAVSDGWMLLHVESITRITGLDTEEQSEARSILRKIGLLREGMAFDDPAMCLDINRLSELLDGDSE